MVDSSTAEILHNGMLKYILCRTASDDKPAFSAGQEHWSQLSGFPGFCGQAGGWAIHDQDLAVILGMWEDSESIDRFMAELHDQCFDHSGQRNLIREIEVTAWSRVIEADAGFAGIAEAETQGGVLRIADCMLLDGMHRREHFIRMQSEIWNPAMKDSGVLGSSTWTAANNPKRFLITSLWKSEEHLRSWLDGKFHQAWAEADVEDDCEAVSGKLVNLEYSWRVN
jgi:heme-degrading monooxygenase HmoA